MIDTEDILRGIPTGPKTFDQIGAEINSGDDQEAPLQEAPTNSDTFNEVIAHKEPQVEVNMKVITIPTDFLGGNNDMGLSVTQISQLAMAGMALAMETEDGIANPSNAANDVVNGINIALSANQSVATGGAANTATELSAAAPILSATAVSFISLLINLFHPAAKAAAATPLPAAATATVATPLPGIEEEVETK